jgi:hypothetical protein
MNPFPVLPLITGRLQVQNAVPALALVFADYVLVCRSAMDRAHGGFGGYEDGTTRARLRAEPLTRTADFGRSRACGDIELWRGSRSASEVGEAMLAPDDNY